jgi:hypothetical protein
MDVEDPIYIDDTESYTFFITNGPLYTSNVTDSSSIDSIINTNTDEFCQSLFSFVEKFLQKTSEHFPSSLSAASFMEDILHEWTDPYDQLQANESVSYTPVQVVLNTDGYKIVWAFQSKDPGSPQHSLHLEDIFSNIEHQYSTPAESAPEESREIEVPPAPAPAPAAQETREVEPPAPATIHEIESIDISEIPCSEDMVSPDSELSHARARARERRLIRETRLRAEMTRLRAETLAQRYLKKYENTLSKDTESVLSFSSDSE